MLIETLMQISGAVLLILFTFLVISNSVIIYSWFKKTKQEKFEPNITVVIPAYNEQENITTCIQSIKNSNYPKQKMEIIVVDDGSTDSTIKEIKKFKDVKILSTKHEGKPNALNLGIKKAKYEYIVTIDADTILDKDCIKNLVAPLKNKEVGATTGTNKIRRKKNLLEHFQHIEYSYNNLVRKAFSQSFKEGIWFYGAVACYKKKVMKKINYFSNDSLTEDMDILFKIQNEGYKTKHAYNAYGYTTAPNTIKGFIKQRIRWWTGVLQAMGKNKEILKNKKTPPLLFIYASQWWWSIFSFIAIPMFTMQVLYWLPYNLETPLMTFSYLFRWFSLSGPIYVIYKIPDWGLSFYSAFGVLSGLISVTFILIAIGTFKDKIKIKDAVAIFFYFPFTILLNIVIMISVIKYAFNKKGVFKK